MRFNYFVNCTLIALVVAFLQREESLICEESKFDVTMEWFIHHFYWFHCNYRCFFFPNWNCEKPLCLLVWNKIFTKPLHWISTNWIDLYCHIHMSGRPSVKRFAFKQRSTTQPGTWKQINVRTHRPIRVSSVAPKMFLFIIIIVTYYFV